MKFLIWCATFGLASAVADFSDLLYDTSIDPYEIKNLATHSRYADDIAYFQERLSYWNASVVAADVAATTNKSIIWADSGGVAPWLESDFEPLEIEQIYNATSAPHIIFVFVDDWGWNDFGLRSTYMNWTTPTIDSIASEGILLTNYYTHELCSPSRGALLTGRYSLRLGLWKQHSKSELPLNETTLAQEMSSAGYVTYMVGKWHLGISSVQRWPTRRGFDNFYGYLNGEMDYWTKSFGDFLDLHENEALVTDASVLSTDMHSGYVFESAAESFISSHVANYPSLPMFLYYALQLIHLPWSAPAEFLSRCQVPSTIDDDYVHTSEYNYCGLNVMLDEVIANLTCTLKANDMLSNTIMVIASDNGGEGTISGNSYPLRGQKGSYFKGGVAATAMIHSALLPEDVRGTKYEGLMHVTDWLPTLMNLATEGAWTGSYSDAELDGVDMWQAILTNDTSPRSEIVFYVEGSSEGMIQVDALRYYTGFGADTVGEPKFVFSSDQDSSLSNKMCSNPSLMDGYDDDVTAAVAVSVSVNGNRGEERGSSSRASRTHPYKSKDADDTNASEANDSFHNLVVRPLVAVLLVLVVMSTGISAIVLMTKYRLAKTAQQSGYQKVPVLVKDSKFSSVFVEEAMRYDSMSEIEPLKPVKYRP